LQKVAQRSEKDLEEARQALTRALEKGTSSAFFRKIKKEGAQESAEAGGEVKT
jgi:hypothetical protein